MAVSRSLIAPTSNPLLERSLLEKLSRRAEATGSLGKLEPLAVRLGLMQNTLKPRFRDPQLVLFAADHGMAVDGIDTSGKHQTFEQVQNAFCRLIDHQDGELARYTLAGGMPFTGMVMAKITRTGSDWKFTAIGEGIQAKTPLDALPELQRYLG